MNANELITSVTNIIAILSVSLPVIFATLGLALWGWAKFTDAKAKANPAIDIWDERAPRAIWCQRMYSQAIEWLVEAGAQTWSGAEKLKELNERAKEFETLWEQGKHSEALASLVGYYQAAKSKKEKAVIPNYSSVLPQTPIESMPDPKRPEV